ncbi:CapA family protein [Algiphilus sp. W345]|uniref:CapA family protein n=1 Tax=Banduia mediterranea TaxID=3075609 RepID=A0ABU2WE21_9GAMM|nr:CapA family protein [Algiphilus sp. W345]MDT0495854.1 CapA family protein [Algiphilus sp. W345]
MKFRKPLRLTLSTGLLLGVVCLQASPLAHGASVDRAWKSAAGADDETVFAITGDSIINRRLSTFAAPGVEQMFGLIRGADAAFTNFETLIHGYDMPGAQQSGGTYMTSPRFVGEELAWAGFDLLGLANNHTNDFGVEGMRSTVAALAETDMVFSGVGENLAFARSPGYLDTRKGRVALISTSSSFPEAIAAGPQRKDLMGRPGLNPLRHVETYTVTQETYDTLIKLRGPVRYGMGGDDSGVLKFGGSNFVVGDEIGVSSRVDEKDLRELSASVRDARQQADWVVVSVHSHESADPADRTQPAEFLVEFAHAMIDSGADMVVGHGPHILRGIEVYKGKPIFYSMANFIFENDLVGFQPAENYEKTGLAHDALPGDYYSKRSKNDTVGFPASRKYWQSIVAEVVYTNERDLKEVRLHPVALGYGQPRTKRGQPYPAPDAEASQVIDDLVELCEPYGATVNYKNGVGILSWK